MPHFPCAHSVVTVGNSPLEGTCNTCGDPVERTDENGEWKSKAYIKEEGVEEDPKRFPPPPRGRPFGRFRIAWEAVDKHWREIQPLFGMMTIVSAQAAYAMGLIEYVALCDEFEIVENGKDPTFYWVEIKKDDHQLPYYVFHKMTGEMGKDFPAPLNF